MTHTRSTKFLWAGGIVALLVASLGASGRAIAAPERNQSYPGAGFNLRLPDHLTIDAPPSVEPIMVYTVTDPADSAHAKVEIVVERMPDDMTYAEWRQVQDYLGSPYETRASSVETITVAGWPARLTRLESPAGPILETELLAGQTIYRVVALASPASQAMCNAVLRGLQIAGNNRLPVNRISTAVRARATGEVSTSAPSSVSGFPDLKFPFNGAKTITCAYHADNPVCHPNSLVALDFNMAYEVVRAAHSGTLTQAYESCGGTKAVITDGGDGAYKTHYLHLSAYRRSNGAVNQGDEIATSGNTGTCTEGAHLHFQLSKDGNGQVKPEPMCGQTGFRRYQAVSDCWGGPPAVNPALTRSRLYVDGRNFLVLEFCGTNIHQDVYVGSKRAGRDFGVHSKRVDFGASEQCALDDNLADGTVLSNQTYHSGVALAQGDVHNVCSSNRGLCDSVTSGAVTPAYRGEYAEQSFPGGGTMVVGQCLPGSVKLRNTGTAPWDANTRIAPMPRDTNDSPFRSPTWLGPNRIASAGNVGAGQFGTFNFELCAPSTPRTYRIEFGFVQDGVTWFSQPGDGTVWFSINVVANQAPNPPTLVAPADGAATTSADVTLQVEDGGDPDNAPRTYRNYWFTIEKADGSWQQASQWINDKTWAVQLPSPGQYRWWAIEGDGAVGSTTSPVRQLMYGSAPAEFAKTAPANGATGQQASVAVSWSSSAGATGYEYCADTTDNGACDSAWVTASGTTATLSGLSQGTTYYWQARARNASGTLEADNGVWWQFTTASQPATGTIMHISPAAATAGANAAITVAVSISSVNDLGSFDFTLHYSPSLVTVEGIALAEFPASTGRGFTAVGPTINNAIGAADFGAFSLGAAPGGANGAGRVAYIRLRTHSSGTAVLELHTGRASTVAGSPIPLTTANGTLTISNACLGDFDGDGAVGIADVQSVAYRWNTHTGDPLYDARFDVNQSGGIDIIDVQQVAYRWGASCSVVLTAPDATHQPLRPTSAGIAQPVVISIQPAHRTVAVGASFTVTVAISDAVDLGAFDFTLQHDPDMVRFISAEIGALPGKTGRAMTPVGPAVDAANGTVTFGAYSLGSEPAGAGGNGALAILTLRALAPGTSYLSIQSARVTNRAGTTQTVTPVGGSVSMQQSFKVFIPMLEAPSR